MNHFMCSPSFGSDSYTSFSSFTGRQHFDSNPLFSPETHSKDTSRAAILKALEHGILSDERSAKHLLKTFDISIDDMDKIRTATHDSEDCFSDIDLENPHFARVVLASPAVASSTPPGQRVSENPFLSTPLRLKHFPRLSPTILRTLLRSPSVRADSTGDFSEEDFLDDHEVARISGSPPACLFGEGFNITRDVPGPITPPLTARIPDCPRMPSLSYTRLNPNPDDTGSEPEFVSSLPSPPLENERMSAHQSTMPTSMVEQFRRVIDELSISNGIERRHFSASPVSEVQVKPVTPISASSSISAPLTSNRPVGFLEIEFASLLGERADTEEAEAEQLVQMARRLRNLAESRRTLARLMQNETD